MMLAGAPSMASCTSLPVGSALGCLGYKNRAELLFLYNIMSSRAFSDVASLFKTVVPLLSMVVLGFHRAKTKAASLLMLRPGNPRISYLLHFVIRSELLTFKGDLRERKYSPSLDERRAKSHCKIA